LSQNEQRSLAAEVKRRLDDLFQEEDAPTSPNEPQSLLEALKAVVLSMEWEISDVELKKLLSISGQLKKEHKGDPLLYPFAQLLNSLGRYIDKYRAKADPDAIKLLSSTFEAYENAFKGDSLSVNEKKQLLAVQVDMFKELKKKISSKKRVEARPKAAKKVKAKKVSAQAMGPLLEAIREVIKEEFEQLRDELKAMLGEKGSK